MSKSKTIKFELDNEVIFKLKVEGSDEVVDKLTSDVFFNSMLRSAAETLVKRKLEPTKQEQPS